MLILSLQFSESICKSERAEMLASRGMVHLIPVKEDGLNPKSRKRIMPDPLTEPPAIDPIYEARVYCNVPSITESSMEGHAPHYFKLVSVHVLIRHGDRYPLYAIPKTKRPEIDCTLVSSRKPSHPRLEAFVRHMSQGSEAQMDGTLGSLPRYPSHSLCEMGELTQTAQGDPERADVKLWHLSVIKTHQLEDERDRQEKKLYFWYALLAVHPLLNQTVNRMQRIADGKKEELFVLYSAHDVTLSPVLSALGITEARFPRFAARLVFELWQDGKKPREHFIRVLYNGFDVTFQTSFCREHNMHSRKPMCPLEKFVHFVKRGMFSVFNSTNYYDACRRRPF
ncbi:Acid phosphatase-like protein 2 [Chelonia mydas]|uniref:2-phosphoxylose phosphatase 1 n=1 Tax=Chelonia mydas TaxID=8469 RepID=M7C9K2_CHEMY|nr:Acid phosphatase-like protein 2 [Chelonia mydas]